MASDSTFRGYGPEQGYGFLRETIALNDYQALGALIEAKFLRDNLRLCSGADDAGMGSVVQVVQQLGVGQTMSAVQSELAQLRSTLASLIEQKLERVTRSLERMQVAPSSASPGPSGATAAGAGPSTSADSAAETVTAVAATSAGLSPDAGADGTPLVRCNIADNSQRPAPIALKGARQLVISTST